MRQFVHQGQKNQSNAPCTMQLKKQPTNINADCASQGKDCAQYQSVNQRRKSEKPHDDGDDSVFIYIAPNYNNCHLKALK